MKKSLTLAEITEMIAKYDAERGWSNQEPEDHAKSIMIEAAELLEHFQWDATNKAHGKTKPKDWQEIKYEVSDILWYLVAFCRLAKIDPTEAFLEKYKLLEKKYPKEMFDGKHNEEAYKKQKAKYRVGK